MSSPALKIQQQQEPLTPLKAFERWHEHHPVANFPIMVVVTTSGGGIKAAYWTTQVLTTLQKELGEKFSSSIVLITAASGGSVGTMYFVDAYTMRQVYLWGKRATLLATVATGYCRPGQRFTE